MRVTRYSIGGQAEDLPVPVQGAYVHARFSWPRGARRALAIAHPSVLPSACRTASAPRKI